MEGDHPAHLAVPAGRGGRGGGGGGGGERKGKGWVGARGAVGWRAIIPLTLQYLSGGEVEGAGEEGLGVRGGGGM